MNCEPIDSMFDLQSTKISEELKVSIRKVLCRLNEAREDISEHDAKFNFLKLLISSSETRIVSLKEEKSGRMTKLRILTDEDAVDKDASWTNLVFATVKTFARLQFKSFRRNMWINYATTKTAAKKMFIKLL